MEAGAEQVDRFQVGPDLYVVLVDIMQLREQDLNAQVMQPRHFDRLAENIRNRQALESLPYCVPGSREGSIEIVSGHHRVRAARVAGLPKIPVLLDVRPMRRSEVIAKQIAHNELHGSPDQQVLAQLVAMIDNVDDLLATGLPEEKLPTVDSDDTKLAIPKGEFDWRAVTLMFLPHQLEDLRAAVEVIDSGTDLIGVASVDQFEEFASAVLEYGRAKEVRSMATSVALLIEIARREVEEAKRRESDASEGQP